MPLKTEYEYIRFVQMPIVGMGRKTHIYACQNIRHGAQLGSVQWDGAWRQYVYHPFPQTIYSRGCLDDISDFLRQLMVQRKGGP